MDFGQALNELKRGHVVARKDWKVQAAELKLIEDGTRIERESNMSQGHWLPLDTDLLANDWFVVE